jgi:NAD(P)-dependent dehydrogenase (short-subunit alcohol dehydrogenase family)
MSSSRRWSVDEMPSLAGRTAVVTGANSGIGWSTAFELAKAGAEVTMACRNLAKAEVAADLIRAAVPERLVRVMQLDVSSLDSVRTFAATWDGPLDLLVNNAGTVHVTNWTPTVDGFEMQFGTNHLGHFALTGLLMPRLLASPAGRVVTVSSITHKRGDRRCLLANPAEGYRPTRAYAQSKLANLSFALELQRRSTTHRSRLVSTAAHPGVAATDVASTRGGVLGRIGPPLMRYVFPSSASGALPSLYAATVAAPGSYTGPKWLFESRGPIAPAKVNPLALDAAFGAELWTLSERMTGVAFRWA